MKKIVFNLILWSVVVQVHGQASFLSENFGSGSGTTPPTGWSQNQLYTTAPLTDYWEFSNPGSRTPGGNFNGNFAIFDSDNYSNNGVFENIALESPQFNTQGYDTVWLKYDIALSAGGTANGMIEVFNGQTWETILTYPTTSVASRTDSIDVSQWLSNNCNARVRFRWTSNSAGWWAVDNVSVYSYGVAKNYNASPKLLISPANGLCGNTAATVSVLIRNDGLLTIGGFPVSVIVYDGNQTQTITQNAPGNIARCSDTVMTFTNTVNVSTDSTYTIRIITGLANDQNRINSDTLLVENFKIIRPPVFPQSTKVQVCGVGNYSDSIDLDADNSAFWYETASSTQVINRGKYINIPNLVKDTTLWVETLRKVEKRYPFPNRNPNVGYNNVNSGLFMDVIAKSDILIDSLEVDVRSNTTFNYEVYIIRGTYQGNTTNPTPWQRYHTGSRTVTAPSANNKIYVGSIPVNAGDTIGIYLWNTSANTIEFSSGPVQAENDDIKYYSNQVNPTTTFSAILNNFGYGGTFYYSRPCFSNRVDYTFDVDPRPSGSALVNGAPFKGFNQGRRDAVAELDTISYEITPPTGYNNADFGTTWIISSMTFETASGTSVPSTDTFNLREPSAAGNGYLAYSPSLGWADSTLFLRVTVTDLTNIKRCDTLLVKEIFIAPTPKTSFIGRNVCQGTPIDFENATTISSGFITFEWEFGDGTGSSASDPVKTYDNFGRYPVKLTATSDIGVKKDTLIYIEVFEIPKVAFRVVNACEGTDVQFQNQTTISGGASINYEWLFGDGQSSTMQSPSHQYASHGGYRVTLRATANGCVNQLTKNANQFAKPTADFSFSGRCQGAPVMFENESSIASNDVTGVKWIFEPGEIATINQPSYTYTTSGNKEVKLIVVSQFNCQDSITKTIAIAPGPVASFSNGQVCDISPTTFINTSIEPAGLLFDYTWDFGDGKSSKDKSPVHQFTTLGSKVVTLTVDASNNCKSIFSKEIKVLIQPKAAFDVSGNCANEEVDFRNRTTVSGGRINYSWNFGDGTTGTGVAPKKVYSPASSTTYTVELIASILNGCSDTAREVLTINERPVCTYTFTSTLRGWGREWKFTPDNKSYGSNAYTWLIEGQGIYSDIEPTVTFDAAKEYRVKLFVNTADGCSCLDSTGKIDLTMSSLAEDALNGVSINMYPNPATDWFTIVITGAQIEELLISDMSGKRVNITEQMSTSESVRINTESLSSGFYLVQIKTNLGWSVRQMAIQR